MQGRGRRTRMDRPPPSHERRAPSSIRKTCWRPHVPVWCHAVCSPVWATRAGQPPMTTPNSRRRLSNSPFCRTSRHRLLRPSSSRRRLPSNPQLLHPSASPRLPMRNQHRHRHHAQALNPRPCRGRHRRSRRCRVRREHRTQRLVPVRSPRLRHPLSRHHHCPRRISIRQRGRSPRMSVPHLRRRAWGRPHQRVLLHTRPVRVPDHRHRGIRSDRPSPVLRNGHPVSRVAHAVISVAHYSSTPRT